MCGIAGIIGAGCQRDRLENMLQSQRHRGPDAEGLYVDPGTAGLAHNRLSIIDLSEAGRQPMSDPAGRYFIVLNGEIYNYLELRQKLSNNFPFRSQTDTEVLLAAFLEWGPACLERLIGMFAFAVWDSRDRKLFAARDRFGVKPFYYCRQPDAAFYFASEIQALHAAGIEKIPDVTTWAAYLGSGRYDHGERTFWQGIYSLPPGHVLEWWNGRLKTCCWYDLADRLTPEEDPRNDREVEEEYLALLKESIRLRFRSDVPVGINLSGGLDSSTLLGLVRDLQGPDSHVKAFTFITGDSRYDELPWVHTMLARTRHPSIISRLSPEDVPELARSVQEHQDEPFGGLPTLAYAKLFETARRQGVIVLLDGQGMDEQWAGYDYYRSVLNNATAGIIQGTWDRPVRPECLNPEFLAQAPRFESPTPFDDRLRNLQYRDIRYTKLPRALRFNDRVSMRVGTELREPFLDHRLVELAFRQPEHRKLNNSTAKILPRRLTEKLLPEGVVEAPKRALQTPQREWLRGPLREWAKDRILAGLQRYGGIWLDGDAVLSEWRKYLRGESDNSFYVWQWISLGLMFGKTG